MFPFTGLENFPTHLTSHTVHRKWPISLAQKIYIDIESRAAINARSRKFSSSHPLKTKIGRTFVGSDS